MGHEKAQRQQQSVREDVRVDMEQLPSLDPLGKIGLTRGGFDANLHEERKEGFQGKIKWDSSPSDEGYKRLLRISNEDQSSSSTSSDYPCPQHFEERMRSHLGFKAMGQAAQACVRLHRLSKIRATSLNGTPISRFKVCGYLVVTVVRLQVTLPGLRRRKFELWHLQNQVHSHHFSHKRVQVPGFVFRSRACAILFCTALFVKLHRAHANCTPLNTALNIISETFKVKLEQALNQYKCKVLFKLLSSIESYLNTFRVILYNIQNGEFTSSPREEAKKHKGLSASYYTTKDLCRWLLLCKQYVMDCTGYLPSRKVFAKLESANTIQCLVLDLNKCFHQLQVKVEALTGELYNDVPMIKEFGWEREPPCLPGSSMGLFLHFEAKKDLSRVLDQLKHQHAISNSTKWTSFMINWKNRLTAAEEAALAELLLARLSYDTRVAGTRAENQEALLLEFVKHGLFVDKKHVKVVRFLGAGSYGKVEEVLCFGERYAMKTIRGLSSIEDVQEAVIQTRLHHPNILKLIWYTRDYESENTLSLLMEVMGSNLETFIAQQARSTKGPLLNYPLVSLDIMQQVAKGMSYLHGQGVMHRDLKSGNVLVDFVWSPDAFKEGYVHVKVGDFGLAKVKEAGHGHAALHTRNVGTKFWRAPEVFWQEPHTELQHIKSSHSVDSMVNTMVNRENESNAGDGNLTKYSFSADVYSFAMTCYEILTGEKPFARAPNKAGLKERIVKLHERPALPEEHIHPGLRNLVERCWDANPATRPPFPAICAELDLIKHDLIHGNTSTYS